MAIFKFISSAAPGATILTVISFAVLVIKVFILNRWVAPSRYVYDLGVLLEAVLASIIASYIFYLFVVHLKEVNDKKAVGPYIDRHTSRVVGSCQAQLNDLGSVINTKVELKDVTAQTILMIFSKIQPYSNAAPLLHLQTGMYSTWLQYFQYYRQRTRESVAKVITQLIYANAEEVSLLIEIDDCTHFALLPHLLEHPMSNSDMSVFADSFHRYCMLCRKLMEHQAAKRGGAK